MLDGFFGRVDLRSSRPNRREEPSVNETETIFAFRSDAMRRILNRLDAASRVAQALERCLPAIVGLGDREKAEQEALEALAAWESATR